MPWGWEKNFFATLMFLVARAGLYVGGSLGERW